MYTCSQYRQGKLLCAPIPTSMTTRVYTLVTGKVPPPAKNPVCNPVNIIIHVHVCNALMHMVHEYLVLGINMYNAAALLSNQKICK